MICGIREANVWHVKLTAIRKAPVVQLRKGVAFIHSGLAACGMYRLVFAIVCNLSGKSSWETVQGGSFLHVWEPYTSVLGHCYHQ